MNTTSLVVYLSLGSLAFAVLQSLVTPVLPTLTRELDTTTSNAGWVLTAYLLAVSVLTPILGRLGDLVGKRRVLIGVLAVMVVGTLLAALAPNLGVLIVARVLQGAAGAILPLSIGLVRDELPPDRVSITIGFMSAIWGIGSGPGTVAAGPIVDNLSWRWLFWIPLALIVIALLGSIFGLRDSGRRSAGRLDFAGAGILALSLVSLVLTSSQGQAWGWVDGKTLGLLALGVVTMLGFVLFERRRRAPLINMGLMRRRGVWATDLVALVLGFAMFGTFLLVPIILLLPEATGYGFGRSVTAAGLFLLPTVMMLVLFPPLAGALVRRSGAKPPMVLGTSLVAVGFVVPAIAHGALWQLLVSGVIVGVGLGIAFTAVSNAIIAQVPAAETGESIGVNSVARTIGGSIGTAVLAALLTSQTTALELPTDRSFTMAFWLCAGVAGLAVPAALALPGAGARRDAVPRSSKR
ncbi:MFS transporter [Actinoplanes sp. M2I2]|uniref:MFS transporter n=1 Tax=Actinoplanes sp. M2I2 TaxID=1734444 RepID=UPI0020207B8F|nr:MFS transporter [Actinoplanes sp. M2I2]